MVTAIIPLQQPSHAIIIDRAPAKQLWQEYFDPYAALEQVKNHIETLPGSRNERHTMRAYLSSLADYCAYLGAVTVNDGGEDYTFYFETMSMPTKQNTADYIAYCKKRGLTSSTVTRYMAAVRHFLKALEEQQAVPENGNDFVYIMESQRQFRLAITVKNPPADTSSNRPKLEQHGTRLNIAQVNTLFGSFHPSLRSGEGTGGGDINTITGKRDIALLYLGITSGLRASELARMTLDNIKQGNTCWEIHVRGKRSNMDPIGIDGEAYDLIMQYVEAFNNALHPDDPRRIQRSTALWQPLLRGDAIPPLGLRGKTPINGLKSRAILRLVERRTYTALGHEITAHDMRRTCASLMRSNGFEWDEIRAQLRHKSIATTEKYVGKEQNLSKALLSNRITFDIPTETIQRLPNI